MRGKLTLSTFSTQPRGCGWQQQALITLLIDGGRPTWLTETQFHWKKEAVREKWNGGENKKEGKIHSHCFLKANQMQVWQRWALDPFID